MPEKLFLAKACIWPFFLSTNDGGHILNRARILEALLIAGITLFSTVQVLEIKFSELEKDMQEVVTNIKDLNKNHFSISDGKELTARIRVIEKEVAILKEKK